MCDYLHSIRGEDGIDFIGGMLHQIWLYDK